MKVVKCKRCGREFEVEKATGFKYCKDCLIEIKKERQSRQNKSDFQKRQEKLLEGVEGVDYIIDFWNGYATKLINGKWMEVHHPGKTIEDYKQDFPNAPLVCSSTSNKISDNTKSFMNTPEMKKYFSEKISGDKNPNAKCNTTEEQRKSVSPFSKSFKGYVGMTDEEINNHIAGCIKLDKVGRTTNQIEYWTNRGYSLEDAKELVSERHRTPISKFENECKTIICNKLNITIPKKQRYISNTNGEHYSYDLTIDHKIIEFNGDYWHCNPMIYKCDYFNKTKQKTASEIWEYDKRKIKCAELHGYKVLTIWESEYNKDKEGTIQKCIDFLLN